jgi:hypothetical protein
VGAEGLSASRHRRRRRLFYAGRKEKGRDLFAFRSEAKHIFRLLSLSFSEQTK